MGCGSGATRGIVRATIEEANYKVQVSNPKNGQLCNFTYKSNNQSISLTTLMNYLSFDVKYGLEIDGNFISIYNRTEDKYEYYVQRLVGTEIQDEKNPKNGKIWIVYVNDVKTYWNDVVNNDIKVTVKDRIVWKFEDFETIA
ncbi:hypothetical protein SteCoe_27322 [Stentor coeruleus]|uniref:DUF4430 domain-containing protein n=1 Tax=Stentor coeruleus TaxID=5963 RepID=A0A1R2BAW4_9CILI|nr:hypothetical protein SteCoe_27322 [Stentor coeruleus]